jgi:hypothetical protein
MVQIPPELTAALGQLSPAARLDLLRALVSPESGRLERIWGLYDREDTRQAANLLIDLESDPLARGLVIDTLLAGHEAAGPTPSEDLDARETRPTP